MSSNQVSNALYIKASNIGFLVNSTISKDSNVIHNVLRSVKSIVRLEPNEIIICLLQPTFWPITRF